jgi:hypothetical protein
MRDSPFRSGSFGQFGHATPTTRMIAFEVSPSPVCGTLRPPRPPERQPAPNSITCPPDDERERRPGLSDPSQCEAADGRVHRPAVSQPCYRSPSKAAAPAA